MRALTVRQPWASLIVAGLKDVENRTWPVPRTVALFDHGSTYVADGTGWYVAGDLRIAIHAGKQYDYEAAHRADLWAIEQGRRREEFDIVLGAHDRLGVLLGYVTVTGYHHAAEEFVPCSHWSDRDCWHWTLADPQPLDEPIPMRGRQGLWTVPPDALAEVAA